MTDLVMIEWLDSRRPDSGWKHLADRHEWAAVKCASVGWLVADDGEKKVLAPNMGDIDDASNMQLSGEIIIPTSCIVQMTRLHAQAAQAVPQGFSIKVLSAIQQLIAYSEGSKSAEIVRHCRELSAWIEAVTGISTEHGPWIESTLHEGETYCKRCLVRSPFADRKKCDPHIVLHQQHHTSITT